MTGMCLFDVKSIQFAVLHSNRTGLAHPAALRVGPTLIGRSHSIYVVDISASAENGQAFNPLQHDRFRSLNSWRILLTFGRRPFDFNQSKPFRPMETGRSPSLADVSLYKSVINTSCRPC